MPISGGFTRLGALEISRIARLNSDGKPDASFAPDLGITGLVRTLAVQSNDKVLIAEDFTTVAGFSRFRIARLNQNGGLDVNFDTSVNSDIPANILGINVVRTIAIQGDDKILIGGDFSGVENFERINLAKQQHRH